MLTPLEENEFTYRDLLERTRSLKNSLVDTRSKIRHAIKKSSTSSDIDVSHLLNKILHLTEQLALLKKVNLKTLKIKAQYSTFLTDLVEFAVYQSTLEHIEHELDKIHHALTQAQLDEETVDDISINK
jgi:hypothetical protein